jgi:hypothetical protein
MVSKMFLVLLLSSTGLFLTAPNRELALRKKVNQYYNAFSEGRYDLMWDMSSREFHKRNDNDKAAYVAYLRKAGRIRTRANIKEIQITADRAVVIVVLSLWSEQDKKWFDEEQHNVWVSKKGRWLFDRQADEGSGL